MFDPCHTLGGNTEDALCALPPFLFPGQVIWRMMSHTLRFSAFLATVMLSFALAFHAVFHTCGTSASEPQCTFDEDEIDHLLGDAFGTFGDSFVTVFGAALGGPDLEIFNVAGDDCRCNLPDAAANAGIFMMVVSASVRAFRIATVRQRMFCFVVDLVSVHPGGSRMKITQGMRQAKDGLLVSVLLIAQESFKCCRAAVQEAGGGSACPPFGSNKGVPLPLRVRGRQREKHMRQPSVVTRIFSRACSLPYIHRRCPQ